MFLSIKGDSNEDNKHDEMDNYIDEEAKISEEQVWTIQMANLLIYIIY